MLNSEQNQIIRRLITQQILYDNISRDLSNNGIQYQSSNYQQQQTRQETINHPQTQLNKAEMLFDELTKLKQDVSSKVQTCQGLCRDHDNQYISDQIFGAQTEIELKFFQLLEKKIDLIMSQKIKQISVNSDLRVQIQNQKDQIPMKQLKSTLQKMITKIVKKDVLSKGFKFQKKSRAEQQFLSLKQSKIKRNRELFQTQLSGKKLYEEIVINLKEENQNKDNDKQKSKEKQKQKEIQEEVKHKVISKDKNKYSKKVYTNLKLQINL